MRHKNTTATQTTPKHVQTQPCTPHVASGSTESLAGSVIPDAPGEASWLPEARSLSSKPGMPPSSAALTLYASPHARQSQIMV